MHLLMVLECLPFAGEKSSEPVVPFHSSGREGCDVDRTKSTSVAVAQEVKSLTLLRTRVEARVVFLIHQAMTLNRGT